MINKTLIFFSIFFHLISFNLFGNEQLSFDVTEIEIFEKVRVNKKIGINFKKFNKIFIWFNLGF